MVSLLSSPPDAHTALKAAENLVVLAREESGATALGEHLSALVAHLCALALHERPVPSDDALLSSSAPDPTSTTTLAAKPKRAQLAALDAQIALSLVRCIACFARHNKQRVCASRAFSALVAFRRAHTCPLVHVFQSSCACF